MSFTGSQCSIELRLAGKAHPRTCALCGLGPCTKQKLTPRVAFTGADDLAEQVADKVFYHNLDRGRRDELAALLKAFAAEIKRSAIEP
jgi:hypothetical protein